MLQLKVNVCRLMSAIIVCTLLASHLLREAINFLGDLHLNNALYNFVVIIIF